ncbi:hypothetical protein SLE2022_151220 [Rubroshorea leprosula]
MSERHESHDMEIKVAALHQEKLQYPPQSSSLSFILMVFSNSLKVLLQSWFIFLLIFLSLALPVSFLIFSLSLSSYAPKHHILYLESLALHSQTHFEAQEVWEKSREETLSLLRLKFFYSLPIFLLSLLTSICSVHSTSLYLSRTRPSLSSAVAAIKPNWKRAVVTSFCSYILFLLSSQGPPLLAGAFYIHAELRLLILLIGFCFEVYLMAVLGMGLVVSVLEDRFGWDAIRVGSRLMEGRRTCGWVISAVFVALSSSIGRAFRALTDGKEFRGGWAMLVTMMKWRTGALVCLYGLIVLWSYVVTTAFYRECRKRHCYYNVRCENEN